VAGVTDSLEQQKSVLRTQAEYADGIAADWERTADQADQNLHAPPAVVASARETARAHRAAAETIRAQLEALDAVAALDALDAAKRGGATDYRKHLTGVLLYALTSRDTDTYLEDKLAEGRLAKHPELYGAFAEHVQRTIELDESWGNLFAAACDATWEYFADEFRLPKAGDPEDACSVCGAPLDDGEGYDGRCATHADRAEEDPA
jgi:hypothetical protein